MAIVWPKSLVEEIAERRVAIVLGAGASIGCTNPQGNNPPSWSQLLTNLSASLTKRVDKTLVEKLIKKGDLLDAAQIIQDCLLPAEFARINRDCLLTPNFTHSDLHTHIASIDPKIVITTNYDKIYENMIIRGVAESGHNVSKYYDDNVLNDIRSSTRCIIKMHGCISDPTKMILSKTSYHKARRNFPSFFKIIDAVFLTNTVLFIGSSLKDPDLQLILENANIAAPCNHRHYAILEKSSHASVKNIHQSAYNVELLEYKKGHYDEITASVKDLSEQVLSWRASRAAS